VIEKLTREAVANIVNPSNTNYGGNSSNYNNVQPSNNNYNYQPPNNNYNYQQSSNPNQSSNRNYKANYSHNRSGIKSGSSSGITPGYCGIINVGYGFGIGEISKSINALNFDFINGFQLFPYFSVGIGTGVKVWFIKDVTEKPLFIPAFVNLRGHFLQGNISPFLSIDIGYCWQVSPIAQGLGLLFNPTLGVSFKTGQKSRINVGTGYSMMRIKDAGTASMWNFIFWFFFLGFY